MERALCDCGQSFTMRWLRGFKRQEPTTEDPPTPLGISASRYRVLWMCHLRRENRKCKLKFPGNTWPINPMSPRQESGRGQEQRHRTRDPGLPPALRFRRAGELAGMTLGCFSGLRNLPQRGWRRSGLSNNDAGLLSEKPRQA